jgi:hypothetical protein
MRRKTKIITLTAVLIVLLFSVLEMLSALAFFIRPSGNPLAFPAEEAGLHIFQKQDDPAQPWVKSNYSQVFRSDEFETIIRTNNVGLREDNDFDGKKLDIATVGDSFTFGYGVNAGERYSDRLRQHFRGARVASLAHQSGFAPPGHFLFLEKNPQYIPRVLIIGLFAWDAIREGITSLEWTYDESGKLVKVKSKAKVINPDGYLVAPKMVAWREPAWRRFMRKFNSGRLILLVGDKLAREVPDFITQRKHGVSQIAEDPWIYETGVLDGPARRSLAFIEQMNVLVEATGGKVIILYIPASYRVGHYPYFCEAITHYDSETCLVLRQTNGLGDALADWFGKRHISFIDPTEAFRQSEAEGHRLYFEKDAHWTRAGHGLVAELLIRRIRESGYLN